MWQKAAMNKILKVLFSLTNMAGVVELSAKVWVRFRVILWVLVHRSWSDGGGHGEVRGA